MSGLTRQETHVGSRASERTAQAQTAAQSAQAVVQALHQQASGLPRQSTHVVRTTDDTTDDTTDNIREHLDWLPPLEEEY